MLKKMRAIYTLFFMALVMLSFVYAAETTHYDQAVLSRWHLFDNTLHSKQANVKQVQRQWTLFAGALQHQYPTTKSQLDQVNQLTRHYKTVSQWQTLANNLQIKLDLPVSPTVSTDASHNNQATW
ncbi:uncharacterized protein BX664DRAFT_381503 [Halteromyces radiatus]|uniref:uncharacterized protein n=1 Tax=Halteromyces radiatus TaxID=101107 RepID=UPI00221F9FEF|nr:uncharacterized protein BX664DRAFT_381503 [Halteromyces radiatus]KAI8098844.1 hypothetical protein BX664DRAFT_381503 [Halteromyces radiatus]